MWKNRNPHTLLGGLQIGAATLENGLTGPQNTRVIIWPTNSTTKYIYKRNEIICPQNSLHECS